MQQILSQWQEDLLEENKEEEEIMDKLLKQTTPVQLAEVGYLLYNLQVKNQRTNRNDKTTITFKYKEEQLPQQLKLSQGDQVSIFDWSKVVAKSAIGDSKREGSGVIDKVQYQKIRIVIDGDIETLQSEHNYCICITTNTVTYRRNKKVLSQLQNSKSPLVEILFPQVAVQQQQSIKNQTYTIASILNESQQKAVQGCLNMDKLTLIHGPPGTGKTRTLCEYLVQAVNIHKFKILATAASNIAVDNMVERVGQLDPNIKVCRLGHPARVIDSIQNKCLSALQKKSPLFAYYKQLKRDIQKVQQKIERAEKKEKRQLRDELKQLMKDKSTNEKMLAKEVVDDSQIIFCTNIGASDKLLNHITFDVVAIDECAQAIEISCWIPILKGLRLVVAGDHKQLPPTVKSRSAASLSYTLFERIIEQKLTQNSHLLDVQYRMNENIMKWSSDEVYDGKLKADKSVKEHSLKDFNADANTILLFIDTSGCDLYEAEPIASHPLLKELFMSKYNEGEAQLVEIVVNELLLLNVKREDIGVISPYSAQVSLLKKTIQNIEVSTVDGFQGREKECIIISMVRSNKNHEVGFLSEFRRMNVAVTRAKRFVCLIGNSDTVSKDAFLSRMLKYFEEVGETRSAKQYQLETKIGPQNTELKQEKQKKKKPKKLNDKKGGENPKSLAPIEDCEEKSKYAGILSRFVDSSDNEFVIEDLNAFERRIVHELAEAKNLNHQSVGNGELKNMKISKQGSESNQFQEEEKKEVEPKGLKKKQFSQQQNQAPKVNVFSQLKGEQSDEDEQLQQQQQRVEKPNQQKQKKTKTEKKKKTDQQKLDSEEEFYNSLKPPKDPKFCAYKECQSLTNVLKSQCKHCLLIYCGHHNLPEEHGCGEAAQRDARNRIKTADKETHQRLEEKLKQKQQERGKKDTKKK